MTVNKIGTTGTADQDCSAEPRPERGTTLYRGRFAPSPTGPLHFGSLVAALASYLDARHQKGEWLLRIDDLDCERQMAGAAEEIIDCLENHGLHWDGPVAYQSQRHEHYAKALALLTDQGMIYACRCSRKDIQSHAQRGLAGPIYPGACRNLGLGLDTQGTALRCRMNLDPQQFQDELQGQHQIQLASEIGDFVVRRRDGLYAYQLAVVVDDHIDKITHVVRGTDLLWQTAAQRRLQASLNYRQPRYAHIPVAVTAQGQKLSKQTGARPVPPGQESANLLKCLIFLRQQPPGSLSGSTPEQILSWASMHWRPERLAGLMELTWAGENIHLGSRNEC